MTVLVMGMSKSGTTLTARMLHHGGFHMGVDCSGEYKRCKYENDQGCNITMDMIGAPKKDSLYVPDTGAIGLSHRVIAERYIESRSSERSDWGFKFPYITLTYNVWRAAFHLVGQSHVAIALKRSPDGLLHHYSKRGRRGITNSMRERVLRVQSMYNSMIDSYGVPVIQFEDLIKYGPKPLEEVVGRDLPDMRDGKEHVV